MLSPERRLFHGAVNSIILGIKTVFETLNPDLKNAFFKI